MNILLRSAATVLASGTLVLTGAAVANAASNPAGTGQPSQECGARAAMTRPGRASGAPGSAFNPDGKAGTVYAGEQPQNSKNPKSVSQYDVACFQVSQSH